MPRYSDWFDAPAQTITAAPVTFASQCTGSPIEANFVDAANSPTGSPATTGVAAAITPTDLNFYVSQEKLAIRWTPLTDLLVRYVDMSLAPASARGVQYEFGGTGYPADSPWVNWPFSVEWITSASAAIDYVFDSGIEHTISGPIEAFGLSNGLTFGPDGSPPAELDEWFPGTALDMGARGAVNVPPGTESVTLTVPMVNADIGVNFATADRDAWSVLVISTDNALSAEVPGGFGSSGFQMASDGTAVVTVHYQPPRFRFVLDTRLRQFPRDDYLGGAPRQGHQSQSIQGSARQGWSGSYR